MAGQHDAARARERDPRGVVEERLGHRMAREHALLQPAHEHGAEAAGADRQRVGDQHRALDAPARAPARRRARSSSSCGEPASAGSAAASARSSAAASRSAAAARASAASSGPSTAAARACGAVQIACASAASGVQERLRPGRGRVGQRVERRGVREPRAHLGRGADLRAPHPRLERVRGVRVGQPAGGAQPGQQVGGRAVVSAARAPASTPAPRRVCASGGRRSRLTGTP